MTKRLPDGLASGGLENRRRIVPPALVTWICVAVTLLVASGGGPRLSAMHVAIPPAALPNHLAPQSTTGPHFRLGDAAQPYGWSTVVGDFDRNGRPDVVVADRIAPRANGFRYVLEFSIAGKDPQYVAFESSLDAVTLDVADVDDDGDADVAVEVPLSRRPIGVWLNNGDGHFSSGDVRQFSAPNLTILSLAKPDPAGEPAALNTSPRRVEEAALALISAVWVDSPSSLAIFAPPERRTSPFLCAGIIPRGPPSAALDVLS